MSYNFDEIICRKNTESLKWEELQTRWHRTDLLPLWIADMEFKTPPFIVDTIKKRIDNEIFGYTYKSEQWYNTIINWHKKRNHWTIEKDEILFTPGIVPAIAMAVQSLTEIGDKIMLQKPVYQPFSTAIKNNNRQLINCPLLFENGQFQINFEQFETLVKDCKMFILCNPHNPGGRVWSKSELETIAHICYKYDVIVVSDEIHSDLTLPNYKHYVFANVSPEARKITLTLNSASKTFNIAGFASAYAIAHNSEIRKKFKFHCNEACMFADGNVFAFRTLIAAYQNGEQWLSELLEYVQENINFFIDYIRKNIPCIEPIVPQASYLVFLDCRKLNFNHNQLIDFFVNKAHLALNDGMIFSEEFSGFMRINLACPRSIVEKALTQIHQAYNCLQ